MANKTELQSHKQLGARQTTNSAGTQSKIKHQIPSNGRIKDASVTKLKEKKTNHDMN